ncbi:MAG: hypothetical protein JNJ54_23775 [Myxococcaceae bacterium]|nr:hypothetical protein [Myxococcaceae bacterium]
MKTWQWAALVGLSFAACPQVTLEPEDGGPGGGVGAAGGVTGASGGVAGGSAAGGGGVAGGGVGGGDAGGAAGGVSGGAGGGAAGGAGGGVAGGAGGGVAGGAGGGDAGGAAGGSGGGDAGGTAGGSAGGVAGGAAGGVAGGDAGGAAGGAAGGSAAGGSAGGGSAGGGSAGGGSAGGSAGGAAGGSAGGAAGGSAGGAAGGAAGGSSGGAGGGMAGGASGGGEAVIPDRLAWNELSFPAAVVCTRYTLAAVSGDGGVPSTAGAPWAVSVSVSSDAGARLSSLATCGNTVNSVLVPATVPANVYLTAQRPGPAVLTASHAAFGVATHATELSSGPPASLLFTMAPIANLGDCVPGTVTARDAAGNLLYRRGQTLTLSTAASAQFFTSVDCSGPASPNLSVPYPDSASVTFSYRSSTAGNNAIIGVLSTSGYANSHLIRMRVAPFRLVLSPLTAQGYTSSCIGPFVASKVDAADAGETFDGGEVILLAGSPDTFFYAPSCTGMPITQLTPPAGATSSAFGLRVPADAGIYLLTASEASLGMASSSVTITGTRPTALEFVGVPDAGVRGLCYPGSVRFLDDAGSPTVAGVASTMTFSGALFWTDGGCGGTGASSLALSATASQADFVFREDTAASVTLRATSTLGLTTQKGVSLSNPPPYAIRFSGAYSGTTNFCYSGSIQLISDAGVVTTATMTTPVTLFGNLPGSVFVGNATAMCAALANSVNLSIPNGASSVNFIWRKGTPGAADLNAQSALYGDAGTTVTATNPCAGFLGACGTSTPCCSSTPPLVCSSGVCRCSFSGCIPRGGFNCGSSNNCCSGVISGTTCQ